MGDKNLPLFQPDFNSYLKVESRPERLSGEAGAVISREVIERLGIVDWLAERLIDPRDQDLITHPLPCSIPHCCFSPRAGGTRMTPTICVTTRYCAFRSPPGGELLRWSLPLMTLRSQAGSRTGLLPSRPCPG
jgi:hypothetical protein